MSDLLLDVYTLCLFLALYDGQYAHHLSPGVLSSESSGMMGMHQGRNGSVGKGREGTD